MTDPNDRPQTLASPIWIRGLGVLLIVLLLGAFSWAAWIALQNFTRIGV